MVEDDAMRAVFFDPDDFGKRSPSSQQTARPSQSRPSSTPGRWSTRWRWQKAQVGFKDGMTNTGASPQLRCRTIDVADIKSRASARESLVAAIIRCGMSSRTARACQLLILKVA
jgi:hypothetical protein